MKIGGVIGVFAVEGTGALLAVPLIALALVSPGCLLEEPDPAPTPSPEEGKKACNWAARFVDRDAYGILADIPPNASDVNVYHGPHRFGALPFENRSLETVYGRLQLQRVLHANASPQVPNPSADPGRWFEAVPAGLRIESDEHRVRSDGDDAFVAYVGQDASATRAALVHFLGQVTEKNRSTRAAWADRALENVTPVKAGDDPKRVEVVFEFPDSDVQFDNPPGNLTLTRLFEDLAAEAPPTLHRAPGALVAEFDAWWWVFELEYIGANRGRGNPAQETQLLVDRNGRASFHLFAGMNSTAADARAAVNETYEALDLGAVPNASFEAVAWGPEC